MAQHDRLYGANFSGQSIGGVDFTATTESADFEWGTDQGDARALVDTAKFPVPLIGGGTITGSFLVSTSDPSAGTLLATAVNRVSVAFSIKFSQTESAITGTACITSWKRSSGGSPTDPQKVSVTLLTQGLPS